MKNIYFFLLTLCSALLSYASESPEQKSLDQANTIEQILDNAQATKNAIENEMKNLKERIALAPDPVSIAQPYRKITASKLIEDAIKAGEQQYIINQSSKQLAELMQKPIQPPKLPNIHEKSLINKFMTTIIRAVAQFRPGYGRTEEERNKAKAIITELKKQKNELAQTYERQQDNSFHKYSDKSRNYEYDMRKFDYEIRQQEIIAGKALLPYLWKTDQGPIIRPLQ